MKQMHLMLKQKLKINTNIKSFGSPKNSTRNAKPKETSKDARDVDQFDSPSSMVSHDSPIGAADNFTLDAVPEAPSPGLARQSTYDVTAMIRAKGYHSITPLASTLQGSVFKAKTNQGDTDVVIKATSKELHARHIAIVNDKEVLIEESIVDEIRILRWLSRHNPPASMARFIQYFEDERHIYLVQEDAGLDFLKFVAECHKMIENGQLSLKEWQSATRTLFAQMIDFVDWLHSTMGICHLDISLENLLISNVFVMSDQMADGRTQLIFSHNFTIKFIDFGLATAFNAKNNDFRCTKYVGKTAYKAPKVYGKRKIFDARMADIWSLGVVLFMMTIGAPPFKKPSRKEYGFDLVINGRMDELIAGWARTEYLTAEMYDLLQGMLQREGDRLTMDEIRSHRWLQLSEPEDLQK